MVVKKKHLIYRRSHFLSKMCRIIVLIKIWQKMEWIILSRNMFTASLQHLSSQATNPTTQATMQKLQRQKEMYELALNTKVANLMNMKIGLSDKLKSTVHNISLLQTHILDDELIRWKREQQLAGNGAPFTSNLDTIQEWCENLAELIWLNRQQIKEMDGLKQKLPLEISIPDVLTQLQADVTQLLSTLVTSTFIIEKQPPQVMKTNTRFTATVRLLVGGKLNVHMTPPQVINLSISR